ncbi:MAG: hypothetical protein DRP84_10115 [Spirochaetes bacterium]|nr:MAG: hypothetical protein DRP84_10115 [Spirochaetota bacterium]
MTHFFILQYELKFRYKNKIKKNQKKLLQLIFSSSRSFIQIFIGKKGSLIYLKLVIQEFFLLKNLHISFLNSEELLKMGKGD